MALLSQEQELARSGDRQPFSNGFEGESWMSLWCADCRVDEGQCPLIGVALLGRTPAAWQDRNPGALNRYHCQEFVARDEAASL